GIQGLATAAEAFAAMAAAEAPFASRGDDSGTHTKELFVWTAARLEPSPELMILFGGESIAENPDAKLHNPYGVIPVNPELHEGIQAELAQQFVEWLTSVETQEQIGSYGVDRFGQPLFYPDPGAYRQAHPERRLPQP